MTTPNERRLMTERDDAVARQKEQERITMSYIVIAQKLGADWREAAREMMINIEDAPPGSIVRKMLMANSILRQRVNRLETELADAKTELEFKANIVDD